MENTIQDAEHFVTFYQDQDGNSFIGNRLFVARMLREYAKQLTISNHNSVRPEVVVPSEEWIVSKIKKGAFYSFEPTYNQGLKIGWNEHKEQLKSLNPTLTFTELNHTEK